MYYILRYCIKEIDGLFNEKDCFFNNYVEHNGIIEFSSFEEAEKYFKKLVCEIFEVKEDAHYYREQYAEKYKIKVFHTIEKRSSFLNGKSKEICCNLI